MEPQFVRTVGPADDGIRLDIFLASQSEIGSRSVAKDLIDAGHVEVRGHRVRAGLFLPAGAEVAFVVAPVVRPDPLAPPLPLPEVRVLYEDACLVAIDKPAGLAVHPPEERGFCEHTVASWARARYGELPSPPDEERPGIVHRLDRETSGVMVLARTEGAMQFLRAQFKERVARKEYRCIGYGESRFHSDWIDRPIAVDPNHPDRMTVVDEGGRESQTYYEVVEQFAGFTHFLCRPKTGRTHQIRVHMTSIGHSLVGDRVYRSRRRQHDALPPGAPDPGRQCLHAHRLSLPHPHTHESVEFESPLPQDLEALLAWLRRERPGPAR
jgi:23S rRNA pseudouridine1911/1915/1917 synthase